MAHHVVTLAFAVAASELFPPPPAPSRAALAGQAGGSRPPSRRASPRPGAVDGSGTTRWASAFSDPQWITSTWAPRAIQRVVLSWEPRSAALSDPRSSDNATSWTTIFSTATGDGGTEISAFPNRPLRAHDGTVRATAFGYSLWSSRSTAPRRGGDAASQGKPVVASSVQDAFARATR